MAHGGDTPWGATCRAEAAPRETIWRITMRSIKKVLLISAASFVTVVDAGAADLPVKAKPGEYVKICSVSGDGLYYIPGTNTCLKLGGYLRVQGEYNMGGGGVPIGSGPGEAPQGR